MPSMPSDAPAGDDVDQAHGDPIGRGDPTDPRGLSLPRCAVPGTSANVSEPGRRCAGAAWLYVRPGDRAAGGTAAPGQTSEGGRSASAVAGPVSTVAANYCPARDLRSVCGLLATAWTQQRGASSASRV